MNSGEDDNSTPFRAKGETTMSVRTKHKKERTVVFETEVLVGMWKSVSSLIGLLTKVDRGDMIELLQEMSRPDITEEEMDDAEETLREILRPKTGSAISFAFPTEKSDKVQRWA